MESEDQAIIIVDHGSKVIINVDHGSEVIINVDHGSKVKNNVNASHPIHAGQEVLPMYIHYSDGATRLASSINDKLSMLAPDPLNYGTLCIYKVPEKHRNKNQAAYTPRLVSIGPLHHDDSRLHAMEEYKLKYLNNFLQTFRVPLEELSEYVHSQEKLVCGCYEGNYIRDLPKLSEVILLDGVFIVELFLKNHFPEMREIGDIIFDNPWVSNDILHDLLLVENQLPMRFVSTLYNAFAFGKVRKFLDDNASDPPSFIELAHEYFKTVGNTGKLELSRDFHPARHLVEFLAILHMPSDCTVGQKQREAQNLEKKFEFARCATATELLAAGVKFRLGTEKCLFEVHFKNGELSIPHLTINDSTETFFRNAIAFEQSGYFSVPRRNFITSYVILLDNLIDTHKDVDLLVQHEIINNQLGSSEQVAEVVNNIYKEFVTDPKEFYFAELCSQLNDYSRDLLHKLISKFAKWYAMLRRDYFASPWSFMSVIAAFILLVLTVIQTVCSLLQV